MAINFVQIGKHIGEIRKRRGLSQQKLSEPDIEGKIIIFGHTPTSEYQHNNPLEIWRSPSGGKIGIDCGCGFPHSLSQGRYPAYGRLACLRLDDMKVFYSEEDIPEEVEEIVW